MNAKTSVEHHITSETLEAEYSGQAILPRSGHCTEVAVFVEDEHPEE